MQTLATTNYVGLSFLGSPCKHSSLAQQIAMNSAWSSILGWGSLCLAGFGGLWYARTIHKAGQEQVREERENAGHIAHTARQGMFAYPIPDKSAKSSEGDKKKE